MADIHNATAVYQPRTISELVNSMAKNPNAILVAGCTDIMSSEFRYPKSIGRDGIVLTDVSEFTKVYHGDRYFEAGSQITIQQLLNTGSYIFSKEVYRAIESIGNSIIRNQATIGGSLFTKEYRFFMSCILSTIGATCELKFIIRKSKGRCSTSTRWVPVAKLYNEDGSLIYTQDAVLTRIRIPAYVGNSEIFKTIGNPKENPDSSVLFGIQYKQNQSVLTDITCCIVYPKGGFVMSPDINSRFSGISLPLNTRQITELSSNVISTIRKDWPNVSELQLERTKRLFETELFKVNSSFIAG